MSPIPPIMFVHEQVHLGLRMSFISRKNLRLSISEEYSQEGRPPPFKDIIIDLRYEHSSFKDLFRLVEIIDPTVEINDCLGTHWLNSDIIDSAKENEFKGCTDEFNKWVADYMNNYKYKYEQKVVRPLTRSQESKSNWRKTPKLL
jgi:hypothetical protein